MKRAKRKNSPLRQRTIIAKTVSGTKVVVTISLDAAPFLMEHEREGLTDDLASRVMLAISDTDHLHVTVAKIKVSGR